MASLQESTKRPLSQPSVLPALQIVMIGLFSMRSPLFSGGVSRFQIVSWNCRALLHHDMVKRARKMRALRHFTRNATIVLLQEVHGTELEVTQSMFRFMQTVTLYLSGCVDRAAGGSLSGKVSSAVGSATMKRSSRQDGRRC